MNRSNGIYDSEGPRLVNREKQKYIQPGYYESWQYLSLHLETDGLTKSKRRIEAWECPQMLVRC